MWRKKVSSCKYFCSLEVFIRKLNILWRVASCTKVICQLLSCHHNFKIHWCAVIKINDLEKYVIRVVLVYFNTKFANSSLSLYCIYLFKLLSWHKCQTHAITETNVSSSYCRSSVGILSPNSAGWVEISVCKFKFFGNVIEKSFPTSIEYIDLVQATVESTLPNASIKNSIPS